MLSEIIVALKNHQKGFAGKMTLEKLSIMPKETIDDRFEFLLELCTYADSVGIKAIADGKIAEPSVSKIQKTLAQTNQMSHNMTIVTFAITNIMQELSFEIIQATNNKGDISKIEDIYIGEIPSSEYLNMPVNTNMYNKVYSYIGKSGKEFTGTGIIGFTKLNALELVDLISGMTLEGEQFEYRKYLLENEVSIKKEFRAYRNALIGFARFHMDPNADESKIIKYLSEQVTRTV